jgi:hypothetical protein
MCVLCGFDSILSSASIRGLATRDGPTIPQNFTHMSHVMGHDELKTTNRGKEY